MRTLDIKRLSPSAVLEIRIKLKRKRKKTATAWNSLRNGQIFFINLYIK